MKKKIFIWLDDERTITSLTLKRIGFPDICDVLCCKTAEHCIEWLKRNSNNYHIWIDFDHDLGWGLTGYDVAKFIVENQIAIEGFSCHSMNPVGSKNICDLLTHYNYKPLTSFREIYYFNGHIT